MNPVSRRTVLAGATTLLAAPLLKVNAFAKEVMPQQGSGGVPVKLPNRFYNAVASQGQFVYLTGGYSEPGGLPNRRSIPSASVFVYDAYAEVAYEIAPMLEPRARHSATFLPDGRLVVVGGMSLAPLSSVEIYDPRTGEWSFSDGLESGLYDHTATVVGNRIILSGGQHGKAVQTLDIAATGQSLWQQRP